MFAQYGTRQIIKYGAITLFLIALCFYISTHYWKPFVWFSLIPLLEYTFVLYFFRDPKRAIPSDPDALVSPADGVVTHVEECEDPGCFGSRALRISIFLSVLDVHLNRAAFPGKVFYIKYKKGEFLNAMSHDSLHRNECNDVGFSTTDPRLPKYCLRQIAGLIARRIDCFVGEGQELARGERYGMMKFSSRTDLFIPLGTALDINVKVGDKVRAGSDIIARLRQIS